MTVPALKPSPVLLMVLALLRERPMHPYEMQRLMIERGKQSVITIKRGSIYHAVERLQAAGLIEEFETSREGRRPERTVYQLTEAGRDEVEDWMRMMLAQVKAEYTEFATVVSFLPVLEPHAVLAALHQRLVMLDGTIGRSEATLRSIGGRLPRVFLIEEEYQLAMFRAERDWVAAVVEDFEAGRLTWSREEFAAFSDFPLAPNRSRAGEAAATGRGDPS
jgi:DNA-binding PadR family transcriptional regulator